MEAEKDSPMSDTNISRHNGAWSKAALVVDAIANQGAAKLALATYGFKSDQAWAKAMKSEFETVLRDLAAAQGKVERLRMLLEDSRHLIAHYAAEFSHRNFTDRYGDGPRCKAMVNKLDAALAEDRHEQ